ncbi:SKI/DACH domain-containing protein 1-like [Salvia splendens]|uniref:SKI/DACH domain-containing protein 1-like n=1 Tax=Salvia splendens TaxID=180675 RepID=UPI001C26FF31|nr:SKI/DACH domain-containing protein 1-like [Salvia splendens]
MLHNAGHLSKSHRRGRKGADWAKVHKFYIEEWDLRHHRFQTNFDHATMTMDGSIHPGYMAWFNRITVSYLVQPATQSTVGMNESASSMMKLVETIQGIWHLTSEHDTDPRLRQIRAMAAEALRTTDHTDVMEYPTSQRRNVVMPPRPPTSLRHGLPGVRTGGHGITRQHRLSQQQPPQPDYAVPEPLSPEHDPPGWSQLSGASHEPSQWGARASCDSFFGGGSDWGATQPGRDSYFQNYQFVDPVGEEEGGEEEEEEEEGGEEEEVGGEEEDEVIFRRTSEGSSRPAMKSSSSAIGRAMHNVLRGLSTRKNKGKAPTKFTPSSR